MLPPYSFDRTTADPWVSSNASSGLKYMARTMNIVTEAPMRRCKAAEPVIFGLDMPTSNNVRESHEAVGPGAIQTVGDLTLVQCTGSPTRL